MSSCAVALPKPIQIPCQLQPLTRGRPVVTLGGVDTHDRPYRATAILLRAEAELLPFLAALDVGAYRAAIADLAAVAVRLDGPEAAPLFGQTRDTRGNFAPDRVVLERIAPKRRRRKKGYVSDVAQQMPLSEGDRARGKKV